MMARKKHLKDVYVIFQKATSGWKDLDKTLNLRQILNSSSDNFKKKNALCLLALTTDEKFLKHGKMINGMKSNLLKSEPDTFVSN